MTDGTEPEPNVESLLQANQELRTELDELKQQIEAERKAVRRVGWFGLKVFVGGDLRRSFRAWMNADWKPFPRDETADLAASLVRRLVRVSLVGLAVAVLPTVLLVWQNWEIRRQSGLFREQIQEQSNQHARTLQQQERQQDQQERDTLIVRRAQLLATIYDCADFEKEESGDEPEICPPKAHPRARVEALKALAEIDGADLDLAWADLSGLFLAEVQLSGANLAQANLRETDFFGANLAGANFARANLDETEFYEADLRATSFTGADLGGAILIGADLRGADLSLSKLDEADLRGADLRGARFYEAKPRRADFREAYLGGTDLSESDLRDADFGEADLRGAVLYLASLRGAYLSSSDLRGADFVKAYLVKAFLSEANLTGADLSGADLSGTYRLTQEQIDSAGGDSGTKLPRGRLHPQHWLEPVLEVGPPEVPHRSWFESEPEQDPLPPPDGSS